MKGISCGLIAAASALISGAVIAQNLEEITIQATRNMSVKSDVHTPPGGVAVKDISLSYVVNTAGLDLASHADVMTLEKRVRDAALTACKEIGLKYPNSTPNDADCAKTASDKAMVRVNELVAAAGNKSTKQ